MPSSALRPLSSAEPVGHEEELQVGAPHPVGAAVRLQRAVRVVDGGDVGGHGPDRVEAAVPPGIDDRLGGPKYEQCLSSKRRRKFRLENGSWKIFMLTTG